MVEITMTRNDIWLCCFCKSNVKLAIQKVQTEGGTVEFDLSIALVSGI